MISEENVQEKRQEGKLLSPSDIWLQNVYILLCYPNFLQRTYTIFRIRQIPYKRYKALFSISETLLLYSKLLEDSNQLVNYTFNQDLLSTFPGSSVVKNPSASVGVARDMSLTPGPGRAPGGGNGNTLKCSCLENPMDRGAWWATVHAVKKIGHAWVTEHTQRPQVAC